MRRATCVFLRSIMGFPDESIVMHSMKCHLRHSAYPKYIRNFEIFEPHHC